MIKTQKKLVKAGKQVDTSHVDKAIRNYKQERWVQNSRRLGKEDSLSIWYTVDELEEFLAKVKDHGGDGIRIYFGAYDKDAENKIYAGRQTVILVGTKDRETEKGNVTRDIYFQTGNGTSILAYNLGRPCPPFCPHDDTIGISIVENENNEVIVV